MATYNPQDVSHRRGPIYSVVSVYFVTGRMPSVTGPGKKSKNLTIIGKTDADRIRISEWGRRKGDKGREGQHENGYTLHEEKGVT